MTGARASQSRRQHTPALSRGLSLIELLVAVTIGALLIFGATQVYVDSRNMYEINEATARLQETARYAIGVIEPDVRMSNYWGLIKGASLIARQAAPTEASLGEPTMCGNNFAHHLMNHLEAGDNAYALACTPYGSGALASADTLTVRRASITAGVSAAGRLQICSTRVMGTLFGDGGACTAAPAGQVNDLVVNTYYISRDSTQRPGLPSLRRKALIAGPRFDDQEIIPGVEDLQVQFGVDPSGATGVATTYVNPMDAPAGAQIVAVRLWLLVRSEHPEAGFKDGRSYEYADRSEDNGVTANLNDAAAATKAYQPADGFRRLLVSRTIQIRNALGT